MSIPPDRSVNLICPTCAGLSFERDDADENSPIRCVGCDRVFTRAELLAENQEVIDGALDTFKAEIVDDFRDRMKRAFRGSKHIKIR